MAAPLWTEKDQKAYVRHAKIKCRNKNRYVSADAAKAAGRRHISHGGAGAVPGTSRAGTRAHPARSISPEHQMTQRLYLAEARLLWTAARLEVNPLLAASLVFANLFHPFLRVTVSRRCSQEAVRSHRATPPWNRRKGE